MAFKVVLCVAGHSHRAYVSFCGFVFGLFSGVHRFRKCLNSVALDLFRASVAIAIINIFLSVVLSLSRF